MTDVEIGIRLCTIRKVRGWTQQRLSGFVFGEQTKIHGWEYGHHSIHASEMALLAIALCFSLDVFFRSGPFDITACLLPMPPETEVPAAE